jgi:hypothetical protein
MADLGTSTSATKEQPYNTYSTAAHSMTELATGNAAKQGNKQPKSVSIMVVVACTRILSQPARCPRNRSFKY